MHVIGLMSGTSVDGIDAALVEISGLETDLQVKLLAGATYSYPEDLRSQILAVCGGEPLSMADLAALDDAIAKQFAQAALAVQAGHTPAALIGSHGQTVYHRPLDRKDEIGGMKDEWGLASSSNPTKNPDSYNSSVSSFILHPSSLGYSLQLGRGAAIAHLTGISTVSNFRVADIAVGGQGAPLVPRVDAYLLSQPNQSRCVQNIGGIGNVTYLPARSTADWEQQVRGWDTGPGNMLLDLAVQQLSHGAKTYDLDGAWAATGTPCQILVEQWLQQGFFQQAPPKSTGRELFGLDYLKSCFADAEAYQLSEADFLATLAELTARSIAHSYGAFLPQLPSQVLLCGGGSRNSYLKQRLQVHLPSAAVMTTDDVGLSADFKEAIAFAVLAYWRHRSIPGNLPQVTGAAKAIALGEIHLVSIP
ncbi:MAG: anhydro-N-acetylmuramic acid kinase [Trichocoleus desertorum ATA4-8-CV12]|nr:anhydro-N-acetylmuramic acid kinase [Trichocoleus desertorum ATA4-8-CV12]